MSTSRSPVTASPESPRTLDSRLHATGRRLTAQRRLVLDAVERLEHATAEQVLAEVGGSDASLSLSTVYRALEVLEEIGLLRHSHFGHGAVTFTAASTGLHPHLVCHSCGLVRGVGSGVVADVVARLEREEGFRVDLGHLAIGGWCERCQPERTLEG